MRHHQGEKTYFNPQKKCLELLASVCPDVEVQLLESVVTVVHTATLQHYFEEEVEREEEEEEEARQ